MTPSPAGSIGAKYAAMGWQVFERITWGCQLDWAMAAIACGHGAPVVPSTTTSAPLDASVVISLVTSGAAGSWRTLSTTLMSHSFTVSS